MGVVDMFRPLSLLSARELRGWLLDQHPDDYLLLDVRQKQEYSRGHLPGAISMPLWELPERLRELDLNLPLILYCSFGLRSRAAAVLLHGAGCRDVAILEGGFAAWQGEVATGLDSQVLGVLDTSSNERFIAAAWLLEEGTEQFYLRIGAICEHMAVAFLFGELAKAEVQHKKTLSGLYEVFSGKQAGEHFALELLPRTEGEVFIEGGVPLREVCRWAEGRSARELLDLAIALETNAYDRYLTLKRRLSDENLQRIVEVLAGDERRHLKRLLAAYDEMIESGI
ncbi:Rhodanese-related sulfurtransferase [Geoalkalibacter ferrihydriticus]|uniref:Rhodanese domain-containing protein n=2 Tax=Geoalkalibacter ferrihydriticus TaxID=392333 RepID=A0A0C2DSM9_9BACT|nr:rhodanese-like domain-containing protein [Geoalkalibacter ferrihydriticus]KIH76469.1 hypothetical protein GFER_09745 [Geoalkalibacter ferrihydriticus DSM 17813]SDL96851.1 Rhodanese-related sulfurtransferase [Geoalkalibacter ferrihydriticus]